MSFHDIFSKEKIIPKKNKPLGKITIDIREKNSLVASELIKLGLEIEFKQIEVGDYIIKNTFIERKTVSDFISSMINRRLIRQLQDLQQVESKLLLIEGINEQELYHEESSINENAIRGFLLSISLNYKIPIIYTKDYSDTAKFLDVLARRLEKDRELSLNPRRKSFNKSEQMQFIIEGFPGIGPKTAKKLLEEFGTIKNIINADVQDIEKIIGKKAEIFKLVDRNY